MPSLMMPVMSLVEHWRRTVVWLTLYMRLNPLTGEAIVNMLNGLRVNNTLAVARASRMPRGH